SGSALVFALFFFIIFTCLNFSTSHPLIPSSSQPLFIQFQDTQTGHRSLFLHFLSIYRTHPGTTAVADIPSECVKTGSHLPVCGFRRGILPKGIRPVLSSA